MPQIIGDLKVAKIFDGTTDGSWIWDASVAYYLEAHDLPPEPEFLAYLRGRNFTYVAPTEEQITAAADALRSQ